MDNSLNSQLDVLQRTLLSRPNLEKLVSNTDLDLSITGPADLESMVGGLATAIKITPQTRNLFTITYRNTNPKLAFDVVQTILTTFIESKTGNNRSEMENAGLFLQQQIGEYERKLREAEKKRAEFRSKYLDLLPNGETGATGLDAARDNVRRLQGTLTDGLAKRDMLARELSATPQMVVTEASAAGAALGSPASVALNPRVVEAQRQLDELADNADREPPRCGAGAQAPGRGEGLGNARSRRAGAADGCGESRGGHIVSRRRARGGQACGQVGARSRGRPAERRVGKAGNRRGRRCQG